MLRYLAFTITILAASTVQAAGYGRSYCKSCYVAPVQKVVQPYDVTNIGNLNQFYAPAPYLQQYPVTDAAYTAAVAEQIQYNLQAVNDQVAQLKAQSQQRLVLVVPQVQAIAVQAEQTETQHCPTDAQPPKFSQTQKPGLIQACASCHDAGKKAQKHFDMSGPLDCDQQKAAILAVVTGQMPKGKRVQLTPDELSAFMDELGAWKADQQQPTPSQPEPQNEDTAAPDEKFSKITLPRGWQASLPKVAKVTPRPK